MFLLCGPLPSGVSSFVRWGQPPGAGVGVLTSLEATVPEGGESILHSVPSDDGSGAQGGFRLWGEPPWPQDMGGWAYILRTLVGVTVPGDPGSSQHPGWRAAGSSARTGPPWSFLQGRPRRRCPGRGHTAASAFGLGRRALWGCQGWGDRVRPPRSLGPALRRTRPWEEELAFREFSLGVFSSFPW